MFLETIKIHTEKEMFLKDITNEIQQIVMESKINNGFVHIFIKHTTCGIRIIENEKGLIKDIHIFLEKIIPNHKEYNHNNIKERNCSYDEPLNAHAHLQALLINTSELVPIMNRKLMLGKWQKIFLFELDGPREREVIVSIIGK